MGRQTPGLRWGAGRPGAPAAQLRPQSMAHLSGQSPLAAPFLTIPAGEETPRGRRIPLAVPVRGVKSDRCPAAGQGAVGRRKVGGPMAEQSRPDEEQREGVNLAEAITTLQERQVVKSTVVRGGKAGGLA